MYEFTVSINCGPRAFQAGDRVSPAEIAGWLESLLRQRQVVEVPASPPPIAQSLPPEIKTAAPKFTAKK